MLKHLKLLEYFVFVEENLQVNHCLLLVFLRTFFNVNTSESDVFSVIWGSHDFARGNRAWKIQGSTFRSVYLKSSTVNLSW